MSGGDLILMENTILQRVHDHLLQKHATLNAGLGAGSTDKKSIWLGDSTEAAMLSHVHTVEACLAKAESGTLGVCRVCGERVDDDLLEVDYTASVCLSHLSPQERLQLEDELRLAQTVQQALLPHQVPAIPGLEVAAFSRPAQFVGGDYFDFITVNPDMYYLVLADVAGHGVSASLQMASLQALTRAIAPTRQSPAEVAAHIQRLFIHNIRFSTFASLFMGAYNPATRRLVYCNAGHNPPLVIHREGNSGNTSLHWLRPTGPALGLIEAFEFREGALTLEPRDLLVMYTDGVVEAMDSDHVLYGAQRLAEVVDRSYDSSPREVLRKIRESIEAFVGNTPLADDTTYIVCRVT